MLGTLERLGYDLDALLAAAGLARADVENPGAYLSPSACAAIFANATRERRVPNLALRLAEETPVGTSPLLDYLIVSADSVGQGLDRLVKYLRLVNTSLRLAVHDDDPVRVVVERASSPFEIELTVALSVVRFTRETNGEMQPAYTVFTHQPDDVEDFAARLRCPVRARGEWNGWALPKRATTLPLRRRDPALRRWLEIQAADALVRMPVARDVRDDVRSVLATQAMSGDLDIASVAAHLAVTPRTLQRQLTEVGTTFEVLRDDARRAAAETYLTTSVLSIAEIAYLLGYSEPTAFHRAFKRWHQTTPSEFRTRMAGPPRR